MTQTDKPRITIVHSLPGRLRVRVSQSLRDTQQMADAIMGHAGMTSIEFSPVTRSIVVRFDPRAIAAEEIVLRIALSVSLENGTVPVRVLTGVEKQALSDSALFSAALLLASVAGRVTSRSRQIAGPIGIAAGIGTAYAVFDHGWRELRERGYFDPEVLSLGYLFTAFMRGDFLKASVVTWLMAFGRHLVDLPRSGVEVRPLEIPGEKGIPPRYEVVVARDAGVPDRVRVLSAVKGVCKYALTGGAAGGRQNLFEELRDVSAVHGEVLEGLGWMSQGIPVRFR